MVQHSVDHDRMTNCMIRAVQGLIQLGHIGTVTSIYFGGGIYIDMLLYYNEYLFVLTRSFFLVPACIQVLLAYVSRIISNK